MVIVLNKLLQPLKQINTLYRNQQGFVVVLVFFQKVWHEILLVERRSYQCSESKIHAFIRISVEEYMGKFFKRNSDSAFGQAVGYFCVLGAWGFFKLKIMLSYRLWTRLWSHPCCCSLLELHNWLKEECCQYENRKEPTTGVVCGTTQLWPGHF